MDRQLTVLAKKVNKYRKASKRSQEMNFKKEEWYLEAKSRMKQGREHIIELKKLIKAIRKL